MIFHKLQSMTSKLNLCRITDGQFRWKEEEISLLLFQNLFPISSFDSFTPWGRGGERGIRGSIRNSSYFSNFFPGHSWLSQRETQHRGDVKTECQFFCPSIPSVRIELSLPSYHQKGLRKKTWMPPECTLWGEQNLDPSKLTLKPI